MDKKLRRISRKQWLITFTVEKKYIRNNKKKTKDKTRQERRKIWNFQFSKLTLLSIGMLLNSQLKWPSFKIAEKLHNIIEEHVRQVIRYFSFILLLRRINRIKKSVSRSLNFYIVFCYLKTHSLIPKSILPLQLYGGFSYRLCGIYFYDYYTIDT